LSAKDESKAHGPKFNPPVKKKKTKGSMSKLKTSGWYEGAARSVGISKGRKQEKRERWRIRNVRRRIRAC
jgi:hypothetical protein